MERLRAFWLAHRRAALVFVLAFAGLAVLSGKQLTRTSSNAHFVHMAKGWLDGRVALEDKPPGWCHADARAQGKCREHRFDDWALVWTLQLADGSQVRGYPCRTSDCERERGRSET